MKDKLWFKIATWFGYGLFFVLALVIFIRFTFPLNQLQDLVKGKIAEATGATSVEIGDLGLLGLFPSGGSIEGLVISLPPVKVKTPERGVDVDGPVRTISAEEFEASGSLLGAMSGNYDFTFEGKLQNGTVEGGKFTREAGGPLALEIGALKAIDIGPEGLFQSLTGLDLVGTLSGSVKLDVPSIDRDGKSVLAMDQLTGLIELELADAMVTQPIFDTVMSGVPTRMSFTETKLGTLKVRLKAEAAAQAATGVAPDAKSGRVRPSSVISVEVLSAEGGDLEVAVAPKAVINLAAGMPLKEAILNIHLAIRPNDAWIDKSVKDPKEPGKMTKPNSGIRTLMTMGPLKQHTQDGQFGIGITGPLGHPKVQLERPRTRVGGGVARKMNVEQPAGESEPEGEEEAAPVKKRSAPSLKPADATKDKAEGAERQPVVKPTIGGGRAVPAMPMGGKQRPPVRVDPGTMGGRHDDGIPGVPTPETVPPPIDVPPGEVVPEEGLHE